MADELIYEDLQPDALAFEDVEAEKLEFLTDIQGQSLYLSWLQLGNEGSMADFLEWLKGKAFEFSDFTPEQLLLLKGNTGRGIANIELSNTNGKIKTYTIHFTDNTESNYTVIDGNDGRTPVITFLGTKIYVDGVEGPDLKGATGKSQYQSYLDTTTDNPAMTEAEWSRPWDGVFKESILFSVRKIGVINKAFKLRRSLDNEQQDVYFDVNDIISDNSLCENGQTLGAWKGASILYVDVWYNQASNNNMYNAHSHRVWNPINGNANVPIYENGYIKFYGDAGMSLSNVFEVKKEYRRFSVTQHKRISANSAGSVNYEYWGNWINYSPFFAFLDGSYSSVEGGSVTYNCPANVFVLINEKQVIGGSKGSDGLQTHWVRINATSVVNNKERDGQTINRLFMISGGKLNDVETLRKEYRIYNYDPANYLDIESEMKTFFGI